MSRPNSIKNLFLTGYNVEYVDLREPKPRKTHHELMVYDAEALRAAETMGIDIPAHIEGRFAAGGYHVLSVKKDKRVPAAIDLKRVYDKAVLDREGVE